MSQSKSTSRVEPTTRQGGMPTLAVTTPQSVAEIHRHGATVTHFQKTGEAPLLFLSQCSQFAPGQPIRGGIPICFPWFGQPAGAHSRHGFARTTPWEVQSVDYASDGAVRVELRLPHCPEEQAYPPFALEYTVTVGASLTVELRVTNQSPDAAFEFEECLHTYFGVGDIAAVAVAGLKGHAYLDQLEGSAQKLDPAASIRFESEVDRIYLEAPPKLEIRDEALGRRIRIETMNARTAVVWNPWTAKARAMPDFGDDEYLRMVCVESGNVAGLRRTLQPGQSSILTARFSTAPL